MNGTGTEWRNRHDRQIDDGGSAGGQTIAQGASFHATASRIVAIVVAMLLVSFLVLSSSRAAFNGSTSNDGNSLETGAGITLTDNDSDAPMFAAVTGLLPGDSQVSCITVTYASTPDPGNVVLYMPTAPTGGTLADDLDLTIEIGTDATATFDDCDTFVPDPSAGVAGVIFQDTVSNFAATHSNAAAGLVTWDPDPLTAPVGTVRTFRFTLGVAATADPNDNTSFGFTWETGL